MNKAMIKKTTSILTGGLVLLASGLIMGSAPAQAAPIYYNSTIRTSCSFSYASPGPLVLVGKVLVRGQEWHTVNVIVRASFVQKPNGDIVRYTWGPRFVSVNGINPRALKIQVWKINNHMVNISLINRQGVITGSTSCWVRIN